MSASPVNTSTSLGGSSSLTVVTGHQFDAHDMGQRVLAIARHLKLLAWLAPCAIQQGLSRLHSGSRRLIAIHRNLDQHRKGRSRVLTGGFLYLG